MPGRAFGEYRKGSVVAEPAVAVARDAVQLDRETPGPRVGIASRGGERVGHSIAARRRDRERDGQSQRAVVHLEPMIAVAVDRLDDRRSLVRKPAFADFAVLQRDAIVPSRERCAERQRDRCADDGRHQWRQLLGDAALRLGRQMHATCGDVVGGERRQFERREQRAQGLRADGVHHPAIVLPHRRDAGLLGQRTERGLGRLLFGDADLVGGLRQIRQIVHALVRRG